MIVPDRKILHVDMNNCFASIECLYDPRLKDVPMAVAGSVEERRGIILAKNMLAKERGVTTGEAMWQAREKCPELVTVEPHFDLYLDMSRRARLIYERYTDRIEPFGIDECWLDVTCTRRDIKEVADEIRNAVREELGITVSVGASFNKIMAKLGSDMKKPDATTLITRENFRSMTRGLDVGELLFVGPATKKKLNSRGVFTIGELADTPIQYLRSWFGKRGAELSRYANGIGDSYIPLSDVSREVKSVSNGSTAPRDLFSRFEIHAFIMAMSESVAYRMRKAGICANGVAVSVKSADMRVFRKQTHSTRRLDDSIEIARIADELFDMLYSIDDLGAVRAISVCCFELHGADEPEQLDMFSSPELAEKRSKLNKAADSIRSRYGYKAIYPAVSGVERFESENVLHKMPGYSRPQA